AGRWYDGPRLATQAGKGLHGYETANYDAYRRDSVGGLASTRIGKARLVRAFYLGDTPHRAWLSSEGMSPRMDTSWSTSHFRTDRSGNSKSRLPWARWPHPSVPGSPR